VENCHLTTVIKNKKFRENTVFAVLPVYKVAWERLNLRQSLLKLRMSRWFREVKPPNFYKK
jgi:hypothetical protein